MLVYKNIFFIYVSLKKHTKRDKQTQTHRQTHEPKPRTDTQTQKVKQTHKPKPKTDAQTHTRTHKRIFLECFILINLMFVPLYVNSKARRFIQWQQLSIPAKGNNSS